ncbi:hypothetical protein [Spirosoma endbachense]|nr:hypothetical protein [Spirosoma endbachense]
MFKLTGVTNEVSMGHGKPESNRTISLHGVSHMIPPLGATK